MLKITSFYSVLCLLIIWGCTPKGAPIDTSPNQEELQPVDLGPCAQFENNPRKDEALTAHVLYREDYKAKRFDEAFPNWKLAYEIAPAADGKRRTHYYDGIELYKLKWEAAESEAEKKKYEDEIFKLYDHLEECYGEDPYTLALKGFDYYFKFEDRKSDKEVYDIFKKVMDLDGMKARYFILNPFTDLLVKQFEAETITMEEAQKYAGLISERLAKGLESGENRPQWEIINDYVPSRLEGFEGTRGFYDCTYYINKYFPVFLADSTNCDLIDETYSRLRWGNCEKDSPEIERLRQAKSANCRVVVNRPSELRGAYDAYQEGDFDLAVENFNAAAEKSDDPEKKAKYYMIISKIYYTQLKQFSNARKFALKAAKVKPNWGEPYLLIGRLYASSGPLCGPGRGWKSQIVVWPAIDKWNYAKRIDPSVTAEANKWINRYAQYMPTNEDIFQRTLKVGDSFRVGCWIQETTKIRPAR